MSMCEFNLHNCDKNHITFSTAISSFSSVNDHISF